MDCHRPMIRLDWVDHNFWKMINIMWMCVIDSLWLYVAWDHLNIRAPSLDRLIVYLFREDLCEVSDMYDPTEF